MRSYPSGVTADQTRARDAVRALFPPGFGRCGGCGQRTHELTEAECGAVLDGLQRLRSTFQASDILCAAQSPLEAHIRHDLCECPWNVAAKVQGAGSAPVRHFRGAPESGFFVYRLWDTEGELLYIGSSRALRSRLQTHSRRWPNRVAEADWDEHETADEMFAAERASILAEQPKLNKAGLR